ncbi:hypothetical protein CAC42_960 [Sphaceloma murrayae]|uniref:Uncharacterized protein n=1 Tax=Sphaceloma murrayae TaxID=2082308 RepID=A0A2K1R2T9_9PEZI|nr:hypothetical protein CAC42_960 [Sphaceloma murrayae]
MHPPHAKRRRVSSTSALHKPFRSPLKTNPPHDARSTKTPSRLGLQRQNTGERPTASRAVQGQNEHSSERSTPATPHGTGQEDADNEGSSTRGAGAGVGGGEPPTSPSGTRSVEEHEHDGHDPALTAPDTRRLSVADSLSCASPLSLPELPSPTDPLCTPSSAPVRAGSPTKTVSPAAGQTIAELKAQIALLETHPAVTGKDPTVRLEALSRTWTRVAREAAEILFPGVKERVEGAGGVRVLATPGKREDDRWGDMREEIEERERGAGYAGVEGRMGAEERMEREEIMGMKERLRDEERDARDREGRDNDDDDDDDDEDTTFTMGMMLRGMNIEWELIGWDEDEGQWTEAGT